MAPRQPERRRRRRQHERAILVFASQIPAHRGPQGRLLGLEALTATAASGRRVEGGMRRANIVLLATRGKLLERKLTDRLEQPRSRGRTRLGRGLDEAVID